MFFQQLINGLTLGATYSLVAIGYTLIFGVLGLVHFAHGEVLMVGAFMAIYIITMSGLPIYITIPLAIAATALLGMLIAVLAIKPLPKDYHLTPLLSTIGVTIILQNLAIKIFGGYSTRFPELIETVQYQFGSLTFTSVNVMTLGLALFLMVALYFFIKKSKTGKGMRAVAESHVIAGYLGVNVDRIVLITFGIASGLAGAAGILIGVTFYSITPFIGLTFAIKALVVVLMGGLGNVVGAMIAGLILGLAEVAAVSLLPTEINLQDIFSFGIMFLILIFRPTGLFGTPVTQD